MFFASMDERRWIEESLLPDARRQGVAKELRGWSWSQPPLQPIYRALLNPAHLAGRECPTGRDVYLQGQGLTRAGRGVEPESMLGTVGATAIREAKQLIYVHGAASIDKLEKLIEEASHCARRMEDAPEPLRPGIAGSCEGDDAWAWMSQAPSAARDAGGWHDAHDGLSEWLEEVGPRRTSTEGIRLLPRAGGFREPLGGAELESAMWRMRAFELRRVLERTIDTVSRLGRCNSETLLLEATPISIEAPVDGRYIGIGDGLAADAICWKDSTVFALAWGGESDHHRLRATALALGLESATGRPVDIGCVVYATVAAGLVQVRRDYYVVGDEERQQFIEQRDELMRIIDCEADPGMPAACPATCGYFGDCHPGVNQVLDAQESVAFANLPSETPTWATSHG